MKLELKALRVGDRVTLCWKDQNGLPRPFRATVKQITERGGMCLEANYQVAATLKLPVQIWVPQTWTLAHVRESRSSYWLPKDKQADIHPEKLRRLVL